MTPEERALLGDWQEITSPDGRKYYYNKKTKESSWKLPTSSNTLPTTTIATPTTVTAVAAPSLHQPPPSFIPPPSILPSAAAAAGPALPLAFANAPHARRHASRPPPPPHDGPSTTAAAKRITSASAYVIPPGAIQPGTTPRYATPAEARDAFLSLLQDTRVPITMSWDEASLFLSKDRRYGGLKTVGEKKTVYNEYIQWKRKDDAEESRKQRAQVRFYGRIIFSLHCIVLHFCECFWVCIYIYVCE